MQYTDLTSFSFTVNGGTDYDLNFINTHKFGSNIYYGFDTATTMFTGTSFGTSPVVLGAESNSGGGGFVVEDFGGASSFAYDDNVGSTDFCDTLTVTSVSSPEPSSLILGVIAGMMIATHCWRRRNRPVVL